MGRALIIGCGGVAGVVIHKCCQNSDVFEEIMIASRTKSKCDAIKEKLDGTTATKIRTAKVDADNVDELCALIDEYKPDIVMNIALPYQDLTIMDACLKCGVNYMDTANYEPEDTDDPEWRAIYEKRCKDEGFTAYFDYSWQWAYKNQARVRLRSGRPQGHVPAPPRGDRVSGEEYSGRAAHPILHDLRSVLSDPHELSGERRHAVHHPDRV